MGLTGFTLMAARSSWTKLEEDVKSFFTQRPILESVRLYYLPEAMSCNQAGKLLHISYSFNLSIACHQKLALYAVGILAGGVAVGKFDVVNLIPSF